MLRREPHPPAGLTLLPITLVATCVLLQGMAWRGWPELSRALGAKVVLSAAEMGLLLLLLWNGWRVRRWVMSLPNVHPSVRTTATLVFASLALCVAGDAINRNFAERYYRYDDVIEHSYLADSVWFFWPGYLMFIAAAWRATRDRVRDWLVYGSVAAASLAGAVAFASLVLPGTSPYVATMTGSYALLIPVMAPAALWIGLAFGRAAWVVVAGAVLATFADALIAQFWLFGHGHYPGIARLNFVVYFVSQALLQRFPITVAQFQAAPRAA